MIAWGLALTLFLVLVIGSGVGYFFWLLTRPKKMTWIAYIYQLGEGIKSKEVDLQGDDVTNIKLKDLKPYIKDVLERIEPEPGYTIYRLRRLNKTCPAPSGDTIENWGDKQRHVNVLLHKDGCTLLKKGYDMAGDQIFHPLSYETTNMIQHEVILKKSRLIKERDILQSITPWIVTAISIIGLIAVSYLLTQSWLEINQQVTEAQKYQADTYYAAAMVYADVLGEMNMENRVNLSGRINSGGVPGIT